MMNISSSLTDKKMCGFYFPCQLNGKQIFGAVFIALFLLTGVVGAYSGGDGTEGHPYQISDNADLIALSTDPGNWGKNYIVTNNIFLADGGSPTSTIGNRGTEFTGSFDGQGYTIRNFEMDKSSDFVGLFGYLGTGGSITDLGIEAGSSGLHGENYVGVLVGSNGGSITNCYATGSATAIDHAGGLVGYNSGSITNCYATGSVTTTYYVAGGLAGYNSGTITNCYATGSVTAEGWYAYGYAGGLVGENGRCGSLTNCYATGSATAIDHAGGLVGGNRGSVINCYCHYADGGTSYGILISDITKFWDYDFITGTTKNKGLKWAKKIISTNARSSKTWRVSKYRCQYPIFQWQSYETGTLQIHSNPDNAKVSFNGVNAKKKTNHSFTDLPEGVYNVTVERADYGFAPEYQEVTLVKDETRIITFTGYQKYSGGEGTVNSPYEISDSDDLIYLSTHSNDWDPNFTVTADIDLTGVSPTSAIGNETTMFTGCFDGRGYTIRNFEMNTSGSDYVGLFGYPDTDGSIPDLGIEAGASGVHGNYGVGGLVGSNDSSITNNNYHDGAGTPPVPASLFLTSRNSGTIIS